MKPGEKTTAVGVFADRTHAEYAVEELLRSGFTANQIGFLTPDAPAGVEAPPSPPSTKAEEGAAVGATAGAAVGGLLGAALATVAIPGVGPVIAGGLLGGALAGAVTGIAGGGVVGGLIGLEIPEDEARGYERAFHSGRTLVTVRAEGRYEEAEVILRAAEEKSHLHPPTHARGTLGRLSAEDSPAPGTGTAFSPPP
jgi:hypothetical protein